MIHETFSFVTSIKLVFASIAFSLTLYLTFGSLFYFGLWHSRNKKIRQRKLSPVYPGPQIVREEIKSSIIASFGQGPVGLITLMTDQAHIGWGGIYMDINAHGGWPYFFLSLLMLALVHDTWFFHLHRIMHTNRFLFRKFHSFHHRFGNPTPWAAMSMHPLDAMLNTGFLPIAVLLFPLHLGVIIIYSFIVSLVNVAGHNGFELFKQGYANNKITTWLTSATHHYLHHKYVHCNYALYLSGWDRLFGSLHSEYETAYNEATKPSVEDEANPTEPTTPLHEKSA